jgi:hypothetical protein
MDHLGGAEAHDLLAQHIAQVMLAVRARAMLFHGAEMVHGLSFTV